MDLESESSALESVEDNGLIGKVKRIEDKLVSTSTTIDADKDEPSNSPIEISPPISKGYGLRKWRRIRRDIVNDDTTVNKENSKILKRVLSGATDPNAKHFPGPDVKQDSLGSVGSLNNMAGLAFSSGMDSDNSEDQSSKSSTAASVPKVRYEKTMSHSGDKQRAKYLDGKSVVSLGDSVQERKIRVDNSKKAKGEMIKIEKENSHSSMESADSRSSNFVFMQAASYSLSNRELSGRRMMGYNEENNDHDAHTSNIKDNVEEEDYSQGESVEKSQIKNNGSSENLDPLTEAFNSFHNLQEALKKELQKFQELGKEPISSLDDGTESRSCIHTGHELANEASSSHQFVSENMAEFETTCLDSKIQNLVNNVDHLEIKLKETRSILEVKESEIRKLESAISLSEQDNLETEIEIQDILQKKMETEIEYLIISRTVENLKRQIKVIEEEKKLSEYEAHKMLSTLGEAETKAENLKNQAKDIQNHCVEITEIQEVKSFKKRVIKTTSCLLVQLGLMFMLFNFQLMPESEIIVPT